jgi:sugar-specific transcriptional regulator TrmB
MSDDRATDSLVCLGFTTLEAQVYTLLLRDSPATGYGVAKALGKPVPNVYKALETLESKGAVVVDDGEVRQCRAVPVSEFLARLARGFATRKREAEDALSSIPGPSDDTRIYQLRAPDQVFERSRRMLRGAQQIAFLDTFPDPLRELRPEILQAVERGVKVRIKAYAPIEIPGAVIVLEPDRDSVLARWPGQWLNLIVDGSELLTALLTLGGRRVVQAIWSASPYLSWIETSGVACELGYTALKEQFRKGASLEELRATFELAETFIERNAPGYLRLLRHLGEPPESKP